MLRLRGCSVGIVLLAVNLWGQGSEPASSSRRITFGASVQGSSNALGIVTRLDTSAGYLFNSQWSLEFGVPYYFISPSSSTTASTGTTSFDGLGNVYTRIRFTSLNPVVNYASTVTATAPTGDKAQGLSTGHATVDWSNYFDHSYGRLTPFAEIGFANSVSDTLFFVRPYTTSGFVTHVQGGARYRLTRWASVGGAGYAILPAGQQTVVSRIVTKQNQTSGSALPAVANLPAVVNLPVTGPGKNSQKPSFETTTVTTGSAGISRDQGFSTWLLFGNGRPFNLQVGYTRSTTFDLDTLFFGAGFNVRKTLGSIGF